MIFVSFLLFGCGGDIIEGLCELGTADVAGGAEGIVVVALHKMVLDAERNRRDGPVLDAAAVAELIDRHAVAGNDFGKAVLREQLHRALKDGCELLPGDSGTGVQ